MKLSTAMVATACLAQFAMASLLAVTQLPLCDEGFYGVPAHLLSTTGALRNPVLESAGVPYLRGIDQVFYWMAPMGMVLQAAAFKVFGFGLLVQRELSALAGAGAVFFWYLALRRLLADRVAALAALLLAADFLFVTLSSRGRADVMSVFFAMAALAAYLNLRERSLGWALAAANTACALSGMVHPNGGIAAVVSLAVLVIHLDRKRLGARTLAAAAAPYCVLGAAWGLYIAKAPDLFAAQFFGNVGNRLGGPMSPGRLLRGEAVRYLSAYGLSSGTGGVKLLRGLLPVSALGSLLFCLFSREARRRAGVLLAMFAAISLSLMFLEGAKQGWYLVHLSPLYAAFLATTMSALWTTGRTPARAIAAAQALIVLMGVAGITFSVTNRNLQRQYGPAVAFLNGAVKPGERVFARSEFYFDMQHRDCLRDDEHLGTYSGSRADYIVVDSDYEQQWDFLRRTDPAAYRAIEERLGAGYREVFRNRLYRVLRQADGR